jgi:hypothetical protein
MSLNMKLMMLETQKPVFPLPLYTPLLLLCVPLLSYCILVD